MTRFGDAIVTFVEILGGSSAYRRMEQAESFSSGKYIS